ncbi:hypothetical protein [Mycobacterium colombiense]|nr:hypothetical protein [Mycobacterium colombiense]
MRTLPVLRPDVAALRHAVDELDEGQLCWVEPARWSRSIRPYFA